MSRFSVTKCICHDRSFAELKAYADKHGLQQIEELQKRKLCSCGCQMCAPYVELMLQTGETAFEPGAPYKKKNNRSK
jgi:NAD(P)H-nitrite reductase large subunit